MLFSAKDMKSFSIDKSMQITQYTSKENSTKFNVVLGKLKGTHGQVTNRVSDRAYFILNGKGQVVVGSETYNVSKGDLVLIPSGTSHGISGKLEFLIITAPAFDPADEK